jgi:predicted kinase
VLKAIIMRGLPGCGKSTLAADLAREAPLEVFSTDDYFEQDGVYRFDPSKIGIAHQWNLRRWIEAAQRGQSAIACANTNIHVSEVAPYWATAEAYGYEPVIMQLDCDPEVSIARNVHDVPEAVIRRMYAAMPEQQALFPPWWRVEHV